MSFDCFSRSVRPVVTIAIRLREWPVGIVNELFSSWQQFPRCRHLLINQAMLSRWSTYDPRGAHTRCAKTWSYDERRGRSRETDSW